VFEKRRRRVRGRGLLGRRQRGRRLFRLRLLVGLRFENRYLLHHFVGGRMLGRRLFLGTLAINFAGLLLLLLLVGNSFLDYGNGNGLNLLFRRFFSFQVLIFLLVLFFIFVYFDFLLA